MILAEELKGLLGFGCMRLPMKGDAVDDRVFCAMIDRFLEAGFCYFDTAHGYLDQKSEPAVKRCLTDRYPRDRYFLTDKLSPNFIREAADIEPLFQLQLERCGVEWFDMYLLHSLDGEVYAHFQKCHAFEAVMQLKESGRIRHWGISFHGQAELLEQILTDWPQIEAVQIQFNYVDYEDPSVESRKVYEVCRKHGKPVLVMEPVKGGSLTRLPEQARLILDRIDPAISNAGFALRFAAGFPGIAMVLSGMSDLAQMTENIHTFSDFRPPDEKEKEAIEQVCRIFRSLNRIPCTLCRYCIQGSKCPAGINIPAVFACYNEKQHFHSWNQDYYYESVLTLQGGKASDCLECGGCERICPQHLPIRKLLKDVAAEFET